ncbi:cytochrome-c peroxidase [Candidatus Marithrix sp. Canyon 246]|uniref:cytochrome-c peroxidase n=1 Tax=Candidatus Marithrix sp. Canyon 246 TaxID=1827136 RepID=UPI0009F262C9|nr:cytochrome c peroxidase [Candidatus Marithrix sp. Canyon 246]
MIYIKKMVFISLFAVELVFANEFLVTDQDFPKTNAKMENLGKFLFFDKILSGNKNISCATCHHPFAATGDGISLAIGTGGIGLGVMRNPNNIKARVARNSPHIFNLGALEFTTLFHDGRVTKLISPAGDDLPLGLDNPLAVQAMFPVTSDAEMAGEKGENPIADAVANGNLISAWQQLAERLQKIDEYVNLFIAAFADVNAAQDITYVHAANAISSFEAAAFRCTNSPFDQYLRGNHDVASQQQIRGAKLFYGKARCSSCHSGAFQTDHKFHAIGIPQIGPGKGDNLPGYNDGHDDFGRERVTNNENDRFKFRTPSLRQVAMTGPWGHDGAYNDLEQMVRHHLNPVEVLNNYDISQAVLASRADLDKIDLIVHQDKKRRQAIIDAIEIKPIKLTDKEVSDLVAFLHALTDVNCIDLRKTAVNQVPSGLAIRD